MTMVVLAARPARRSKHAAQAGGATDPYIAQRRLCVARRQRQCLGIGIESKSSGLLKAQALSSAAAGGGSPSPCFFANVKSEFLGFWDFFAPSCSSRVRGQEGRKAEKQQDHEIENPRGMPARTLFHAFHALLLRDDVCSASTIGLQGRLCFFCRSVVNDSYPQRCALRFRTPLP